MGTRDDERAFLDEVASLGDGEVSILPAATDRAVALLAAIRDSGSWVGHDRPDFFSNAHRVALEVMRVDDHPPVGRLVNPTLARERDLQREARAAFPWISRDMTVEAVADTGLPSEDDHNFNAYRDVFSRVVLGHSQKVGTYRARRPGFDLAMLIRDESTAYAQVARPVNLPRPGETVVGRPHLWFLDNHFTEIIASSNADFVIWSTPYKHAWHLNATGARVKVDLPTLAVFDVEAMSGWSDPIAYEPNHVISVEA